MDLSRERKKLSNMKIKLKPITVGDLGKFFKALEKSMEEGEIIERSEATVALKSAWLLRKVLETWRYAVIQTRSKNHRQKMIYKTYEIIIMMMMKEMDIETVKKSGNLKLWHKDKGIEHQIKFELLRDGLQL